MKTGSIALLLSALALGAAVTALTREGPSPERAPMRTDRVAELEQQVTQLTRDLARLEAGTPARGRREVPGLLPAIPGTGAGELARPADVAARDDGSLAAIVDDAVDRKTKQVIDELRIKANKKPAMDAFAAMLELTPEQRAAAERVVVEGQREVHRILEQPAADGTNLLDALIEIAAKGIAEPGKDHGIARWYARVLSETIPGTNVTYGARIESAKEAVRTSFRRDWSEAQYKEFQEWGVDPTEIDNIPGSPNETLVERILDRATRLGADLPGAR